MTQIVELFARKPESLSVQLIEVPAAPIGLPFVLHEASLGQRCRLPEEIELMLEVTAWKAEQADYCRHSLGCQPHEFSEYVTRRVEDVFRTGEAYFLANINLTFLIERIPLWLAWQLGISFTDDYDFSSFVETGSYCLPEELTGKVVSGAAMRLSAQRVYVDTLRAISEAYSQLVAAGVPHSALKNIVPQGVTGTTLWSVSLASLRLGAPSMPSFLREPIMEELNELHPAYTALLHVI